MAALAGAAGVEGAVLGGLGGGPGVQGGLERGSALLGEQALDERHPRGFGGHHERALPVLGLLVLGQAVVGVRVDGVAQLVHQPVRSPGSTRTGAYSIEQVLGLLRPPRRDTASGWSAGRLRRGDLLDGRHDQLLLLRPQVAGLDGRDGSGPAPATAPIGRAAQRACRGCRPRRGAGPAPPTAATPRTSWCRPGPGYPARRPHPARRTVWPSLRRRARSRPAASVFNAPSGSCHNASAPSRSQGVVEVGQHGIQRRRATAVHPIRHVTNLDDSHRQKRCPATHLWTTMLAPSTCGQSQGAAQTSISASTRGISVLTSRAR